FRRPGFAGAEIGGIAVQCRAIRTDDLVVVAEIEEHVRVVEWRIGADAHELLRADLDDRHACIIVKVRNDVVGHVFTLPSAYANSTQSSRWEKPFFRRGS